MHFDDGLESIDAHAMENCVTQDAGIVNDAIELAKSIEGGLDDLAGGDCFRDSFEIRNAGAAPLLDLLDHSLSRRSVGARAVGGDAGIVDDDLGAFCGAKQRDLAPDAAPRAGYDDDFVLQ